MPLTPAFRSDNLAERMRIFNIQLPFTYSLIEKLEVGDKVLLSGVILTARDAAHKRMHQLLSRNQELPFDLSTSTLFYCGPSPVPPGMNCGAMGPTTSARMDIWMPELIEHGLKVTMGKGERSKEVEDIIRKSGSLYLVCPGGAAAYLAKHIVSCETFLWPELGAEAIYKLVVKDFPAYVAIV